MAWPSGSKANTTHTDSPSDSISSARADINQNILNVNSIIDHLAIGSATDGQLMRYNSSSGTWEAVNPGTLTSQSLYIPMGGMIVRSWSQDTQSSSDRQTFYKICTLGGAYYDRHTSSSLTAADTVYGSIEGATVNRPTPTGNSPSGQITSTNENITLSSGVVTVNSSSGATVGSGKQESPHVYGTGHDNYVELPAGTYRLSFINNGIPDAEIPATSVIFDENDWEIGAVDDFFVYNETASSTIDTHQMNNLSERFTFFTLGATSKIKLYQSTTNSVEDARDDGLGITNTAAFGGITSGYSPDGNHIYYGTSSTDYVPSKLGYYQEMPNRYIRIDKL